MIEAGIKIIVLFTIILGFGGGIVYFLFIKSQPKKVYWHANCYQLGEGIKPPVYNEKGEMVSNLKLQELVPYCKDIIIRIEEEHGKILYKLKKLNLSTQEVKADNVETWGVDKKGNIIKQASVLIDGDNATLLKKGYDHQTGSQIFHPMSRERVDMVSSDLSLKTKRYSKNKSTLEKLVPFLVPIIMGLFILGGIVTFVQSWEKVVDIQAKSASQIAETYKQAAEINREAIQEMYSNVDGIEPPKNKTIRYKSVE